MLRETAFSSTKAPCSVVTGSAGKAHLIVISNHTHTHARTHTHAHTDTHTHTHTHRKDSRQPDSADTNVTGAAGLPGPFLEDRGLY